MRITHLNARPFAVPDHGLAEIPQETGPLRDGFALHDGHTPQPRRPVVDWPTVVVAVFPILQQLDCLPVGRVHQPRGRDRTPARPQGRLGLPGGGQDVRIPRLGQDARRVQDAGEVLPDAIPVDELILQLLIEVIPQLLVDDPPDLRRVRQSTLRRRDPHRQSLDRCGDLLELHGAFRFLSRDLTGPTGIVRDVRFRHRCSLSHLRGLPHELHQIACGLPRTDEVPQHQRRAAQRFVDTSIVGLHERAGALIV